MSIIEHAKYELKLAGLFDDDSDYGGMQGEAALEIIQLLEKQGHSGASIGLVMAVVNRLVKLQPLTPLTGEDDEWGEAYDDAGTQQNRRMSSVFREADGKAYWIDGRIFREPDGACYTSKDSRVFIEFPWTPTEPEYVDVPEPDND